MNYANNNQYNRVRGEEMNIQNVKINFDIYDYLQNKNAEKLRIVGENIMCNCFFHNERTPSFGINAETGLYNCFGCGSRGNVATLVKHLDHFDTVMDAENYLIDLYGEYAHHESENFTIEFNETVHVDYYISDNVLQPYKFRHPYLSHRGLSEDIQRFFEIGYDKRTRAVTIPYRDHLNRLLTVKFRSVIDKKFWYKPSLPANIKSETLFGLNNVLKSSQRIVAITEAEIDCMSVWDTRLASAIAIGGNMFNEPQAKRLFNTLSPDYEILLFLDNDSGGDAGRERVANHLGGRYKLSQVNWDLITRDVKDANDCTTEELKMLIEKRESIGLKIF